MSCIDPNQYGFIHGSCTILALISLIHRWTETVDVRGGTVRALLTDYRKAFDLIDHNILCQKLQRIGIKPSVFNWIVDFLRPRSQRVKLHSDCVFQIGSLLMLEFLREPNWAHGYFFL